MNPRARSVDADADRVLVIMSDIEIGAGGDYDDCPRSDFVGEIIASYGEPPFDRLPVDLVLNGDTFDLLKTSYLGEHPHHITPDIALGKIARVGGAHPKLFEAIRAFLDHPGAERRVHFIIGNHDFELVFEPVQGFVRSLCGGSDRVLFPGFSLDIGRVHIEHGSQHDPLFAMDADRPVIGVGGKQLLNLPWANVAILDVAMPLQPLLYFYDRLIPKKAVLDLIPEIKELIVERFWSYFKRDYWRGVLGADPVKRIRWKMLKEIGSRLITLDADVSFGTTFIDRMTSSDDYDLYAIGHIHKAGWWSHGHRKVLQSGCFRDEYAVLDEGRRLVHLPKSYIEVYVRGEEPVRSQLIEVNGPPPAGELPDIFEIVPKLRELLGPDEQRDKEAAARAAQEEKEKGSEGEVAPAS